jgi:hypothetical protein
MRTHVGEPGGVEIMVNLWMSALRESIAMGFGVVVVGYAKIFGQRQNDESDHY